MRTLPAGKEVTSIQHQLVRLGRNVGSIFLNTIFFAMSIPSEKLGDTAGRVEGFPLALSIRLQGAK